MEKEKRNKRIKSAVKTNRSTYPLLKFREGGNENFPPALKFSHEKYSISRRIQKFQTLALHVHIRDCIFISTI